MSGLEFAYSNYHCIGMLDGPSMVERRELFGVVFAKAVH